MVSPEQGPHVCVLKELAPVRVDAPLAPEEGGMEDGDVLGRDLCAIVSGPLAPKGRCGLR